MFKKIGISIITIAFLIVIGLTGWKYYQDHNKEIHSETDFYEKITQNLPVNILINGDSIAEGVSESSIGPLLKTRLESEYNTSVTVDNISLPGNSSFAGLTQINTFESDDSYDLVILCYGQNDTDSDDFSTMYENLLRSAIENYPDAQFLCILESSQKKYTNKINTIKQLCEYYNVPYVDTISAFNSSGYPYDLLSSDGTHPNKLGKKIYCEAIFQTLQNGFTDTEYKKAVLKTPLNDWCNKYQKITYIDKKDMTLTEDNAYVYQVSGNISAIGIDRNMLPGKHELKIAITDEKDFDLSYSWDYDSSQRHIEQVVFRDYQNIKIRIYSDSESVDDQLNGIVLVSEE